MIASFPSTRQPSAWRTAIAIGSAYAVLSTLWITYSDELLLRAGLDLATLSQWQTVKGVAFITCTGIVLALIVFNRSRKFQRLGENMAAVIEASPLPIYCIDREGVVRLWNAAAQRMFGISRSQIVGRSDVPLHNHIDLHSLSQLVLNGESISGVRAHLQVGQRSIHVIISLAPLRNSNGQIGGIVFVIEDVTERVENQILRQQHQTLDQSNLAMREALGVISHELRTPLTSIRAMAEMLRDDRELVDQQEFLRMVEDEVVRMSMMIDDMLDTARMSGRSVNWEWQELRVGDLCRQAVELIRPLVNPRRIHLAVEAVPSDLSMRGDPHALRRLLLNLLTNAQKHTADGAIRLRAMECWIDGQRWVELQVRDTGRGITPELASHLGRPFAPGRTGLGGQPSIGLGLAICRRIAAAHGGRIAFRSRPGRGTVASVLLQANASNPIESAEPADISCHIETG